MALSFAHDEPASPLPPTCPTLRAPRTPRSHVATFTGRARNRALVDASGLAPHATHVATLTWPTPVHEPAEVKAILDAMGKSFLRKFPSGWLLWRMEPTAQGRPHLHLMACAGADFPSWLAQVWARLLGVESAGADVLVKAQPIDHSRAAAWACYAMKPENPAHAAMNSNFWPQAGRRWGTIGRRRNLPSIAHARVRAPRERINAALSFLEAVWPGRAQLLPLSQAERDHVEAKRRAYLGRCRRQGCGLFVGLPQDLEAMAAALLRGEDINAFDLVQADTPSMSAAPVLSMDAMPKALPGRPRKPQDRVLPGWTAKPLDPRRKRARRPAARPRAAQADPSACATCTGPNAPRPGRPPPPAGPASDTGRPSTQPSPARPRARHTKGELTMTASNTDFIAQAIKEALDGLNTEYEALHAKAAPQEANRTQEPAPAADQARLREAFFNRLRAIASVVLDLTAEHDALTVKLQAEVSRLQGQHATQELVALVERFYEIPALNIQAVLEIYNMFGSGPEPEHAQELKELIAGYAHQLGQRAGWRACGYLLPGVFLPLPDAPKEAEKPRQPRKTRKGRK